MLLMRRDCLSRDVRGNHYISVPREKKEPTKKDLEIIDTLQITEDIFNLVNGYIQIVNPICDSQYLFSYRGYHQYLRDDFKERSLKKKNNLEKMGLPEMNTLLKRFYENVVEKQYKFKGLSRIRLGDTRHFAFCNMYLQGFNKLTIARMGGHSRLEAQDHYSSHLPTFIESSVYTLRELNRFYRSNPAHTDIDIVSIKNASSLTALNSIPHKRKISKGYCIDTDFPNNCMTTVCSYCRYYRLDKGSITYYDDVRYLKEKSNELSKRIQEELAFLLSLNKAMDYDIEKGIYSVSGNEKLQTQSKYLYSLINQKAMNDSYIPEEEDYSNE